MTDHRPIATGQRRGTVVLHGARRRSLLERAAGPRPGRVGADGRAVRPAGAATGAGDWGLRDDDAADVFQEVFQAVAAHLAGFRRDRAGDTFRGWLRTITRNKVNDHFRRRQREPGGVGGSEARVRLAQVAGRGRRGRPSRTRWRRTPCSTGRWT